MMHSRCSAVSESENPPGNGTDSGASRSYHASHSLVLARKCRLASSSVSASDASWTRSFQPLADSHSAGFLSPGASMDVSPLRKKSSAERSNGISSLASASMIMQVIWNENMSLCRSKMPVHVYSYRLRVMASRMLRRRLSSTTSFLASSRARLKTTKNESSDVSYMLLMPDRPAMAK